MAKYVHISIRIHQSNILPLLHSLHTRYVLWISSRSVNARQCRQAHDERGISCDITPPLTWLLHRNNYLVDVVPSNWHSSSSFSYLPTPCGPITNSGMPDLGCYSTTSLPHYLPPPRHWKARFYFLWIISSAVCHNSSMFIQPSASPDKNLRWERMRCSN